ITKTDEGIMVKIYYDSLKDVPDEEVLLDLKVIPFVIFKISASLMEEVSRYQIALLNLSSSDLNYLMKANIPFYVEQRHISQMGSLMSGSDKDDKNEATVKTGSIHGRVYAQGSDQPSFIHPSSEPITASMAKQREMKEDIQNILNLSLAQLKTHMISAESKRQDNT